MGTDLRSLTDNIYSMLDTDIDNIYIYVKYIDKR